jgi:transposase-like protein
MEAFKCPECGSTHTFPTPETAFERFCADCDHVWQEVNQYPFSEE